MSEDRTCAIGLSDRRRVRGDSSGVGGDRRAVQQLDLFFAFLELWDDADGVAGSEGSGGWRCMGEGGGASLAVMVAG